MVSSGPGNLGFKPSGIPCSEVNSGRYSPEMVDTTSSSCILRRNEKQLLNDINYDQDGRLRFHVLGDKGKNTKRVHTREDKLFIMANDCLTGDPLAHDLTLTQFAFLSSWVDVVAAFSDPSDRAGYGARPGYTRYVPSGTIHYLPSPFHLGAGGSLATEGQEWALQLCMAWETFTILTYMIFSYDGLFALDVETLTDQSIDIRPYTSGLLFYGGLATIGVLWVSFNFKGYRGNVVTMSGKRKPVPALRASEGKSCGGEGGSKGKRRGARFLLSCEDEDSYEDALPVLSEVPILLLLIDVDDANMRALVSKGTGDVEDSWRLRHVMRSHLLRNPKTLGGHARRSEFPWLVFMLRMDHTEVRVDTLRVRPVRLDCPVTGPDLLCPKGLGPLLHISINLTGHELGVYFDLNIGTSYSAILSLLGEPLFASLFVLGNVNGGTSDLELLVPFHWSRSEQEIVGLGHLLQLRYEGDFVCPTLTAILPVRSFCPMSDIASFSGLSGTGRLPPRTPGEGRIAFHLGYARLPSKMPCKAGGLFLSLTFDYISSTYASGFFYLALEAELLSLGGHNPRALILNPMSSNSVYVRFPSEHLYVAFQKSFQLLLTALGESSSNGDHLVGKAGVDNYLLGWYPSLTLFDTSPAKPHKSVLVSLESASPSLKDSEAMFEHDFNDDLRLLDPLTIFIESPSKDLPRFGGGRCSWFVCQYFFRALLSKNLIESRYRIPIVAFGIFSELLPTSSVVFVRGQTSVVDGRLATCGNETNDEECLVISYCR
ncbi:hypothetical protein Tco_0618209 [Tanacetum coccineum]